MWCRSQTSIRATLRMNMSTEPSITPSDSVPLLSPVQGESTGSIPVTPIADLPTRIDKAKRAQEVWSKRTPTERAHVLKKVIRILHAKSDDFARRISEANGKPVAESLVGEVYPTLATFRFFAKKGPRALREQRIPVGAIPFAYSRLGFDPLGVIGVIAPWNYPFKLMLQDVPAALVAGNSVVIKVSEHSAAIGKLIEELLEACDFPENLVQLVYGYGDLGEALVYSGINKVVFTGSSATGTKVYHAAAQAMIPATLEMGGKDAAIILEDAELDDAARGILWASLANSGQVCASVESIYCPESMRSDFTERCRALLLALPSDSRGTMNTIFQKEKVCAQLDQAQAAGATIVASTSDANPENPYAMNATILTDVGKDSILHREETFGPLMVIHGYENVDDVVKEINSGEYGLTASVWSGNRTRAREIAQRIDSGVVTINDHLITPGMPEIPWFGRKASGMGFSMSTMSLMTFSKMRHIFDDRGLVRYKFWRYPYDAAKMTWLKVFMDAEFADSPLKRVTSFIRAMPAMLLKRNRRWDS